MMSIDSLRVRNYRVLKDVSLNGLGPLTVLCGANGSGKSTVIDVFAFLHETFTLGLRSAWDRRNRMASIRSLGSSGPVSFMLKYRAVDAQGRSRKVTYELAVDERDHQPVVASERLSWTTAPGPGRPRDILRFADGTGQVYDEQAESYVEHTLRSPDLLGVATLAQIRANPRVTALMEFITGWYLSHLSVGSTRQTPMAGPSPMLSTSGDNLSNVVQYLQERDPQALDAVFADLSKLVPQVERWSADLLEDGRLLLRLKDRPFADPILARFASDGTLRLLAYLTLLHNPHEVPVIGIEEPENQLHPKVVPVLADTIRRLSTRSQVFVTTHSPEFLLSVEPKELLLISRQSADGFASVSRPTDSAEVRTMLDAGMNLSELWSFGYLSAADGQELS